MGWKLGVPARALPSSAATRWGSHRRGVWTDCVQSRASQHRTDGRVAHCPARVTCVREYVCGVRLRLTSSGRAARTVP